jgi:hypothetical protein
MKKARLTVMCCITLLAFANGCQTNMAVNFKNATSSKVWVSSLQSGREIEIAPSRFRRLPHSSGDIVVKTENREQFRFSAISAFHVDPKYREARGSLFGFSSVTLTVLLETNMHLYVLVPGVKTLDENTVQPNGYPKPGQKLAE